MSMTYWAAFMMVGAKSFLSRLALADVLELGYRLGPLLVRQGGRVEMQVIPDHRVEIADEIGLRPSVGQRQSFFISASFVSARAPRTGTTARK